MMMMMVVMLDVVLVVLFVINIGLWCQDMVNLCQTSHLQLHQVQLELCSETLRFKIAQLCDQHLVKVAMILDHCSVINSQPVDHHLGHNIVVNKLPPV